MENRRNFYRILHVQPDAPVEIIHTSYRTLMQRLKMHPDLGGDHANATLINEAFETLIHPDRRAAYDRSLRVMHAREQREAQPAADPSLAAPAPAANSPRCVFCDAAQNPDGGAVTAAPFCWRCGSPVTPAVSLGDPDRSRRALDRVTRDMAVTFSLAWPPAGIFEGVTEDVSINGLSFRSGVLVTPGQRVRLDCEFCTAVGTIRHVHEADGGWQRQWIAGVEFITLGIKRARENFVSARG